MLKSVHATGFKSLMDFSFFIKEGLNIFVGPNGSGKTNIVSLFEFLSYLTQEPVSEAIIRAGGVSSVFRRYAGESFAPIQITIEGEFNFYRSFSSQSHPRKARYCYEFSIGRSLDTGIIFFDRQEFKFSVTSSAGRFRKYKSGNPVWDLVVTSKVNETLRPDVRVLRIDQKKIRPQIFVGAQPKDVAERILKLRVERADPSVFSFIQILENFFPEIRSIRSDLYSGRAYNINPNVVKRREDAVFPVGVQADGAGTSSTLYTLWRIAHRHVNQSRPPRAYQGSAAARPLHLTEKTYMEVIDLLKLVNSSVDGVRIIVDPYDNNLRVLFSIRTKDGEIEVPLQNMSDGTAKWLALTIAILSNRGVFAIEEPENFLHPYMQNEILQIIRAAIEGVGRRGFAIITTHSETLLNAAKPEEIITVKMEEGNTQIARLADPKLIDDEVRRSGFGLGYLYVMGVLNNA